MTLTVNQKNVLDAMIVVLQKGKVLKSYSNPYDKETAKWLLPKPDVSGFGIYIFRSKSIEQLNKAMLQFEKGYVEKLEFFNNQVNLPRPGDYIEDAQGLPRLIDANGCVLNTSTVYYIGRYVNNENRIQGKLKGDYNKPLKNANGIEVCSPTVAPYLGMYEYKGSPSITAYMKRNKTNRRFMLLDEGVETDLEVFDASELDVSNLPLNEVAGTMERLAFLAFRTVNGRRKTFGNSKNDFATGLWRSLNSEIDLARLKRLGELLMLNHNG